ncbi:MAG TPA: hypothetical protein VFJ24_00200 [Gaiellales bacterium]|nr:hypothetical protein [Gaiellales bacterium]
MSMNGHRLVYHDHFAMTGGYRLVFTIEPHPRDDDWWGVFNTRTAAAGFDQRVLELLDDGQAATLNLTVALDDGERLSDALAALIADVDREFTQNVLPARQEAEARAKVEAEREQRKLAALDETLRARFAR